MNRVRQFVLLAMPPLVWLLAGSAGITAEKVLAPFTQVLDTHKRLMPGAAAEAALGHTGWKTVQEDVVDYTFAGDAAVANDKVTAVVQQANGTVELYARQRLLAGPCVTLVPLRSGGVHPVRAKSVRIQENTPSLAALEMEVEYPNGGSGALGLCLTTGQPIVELQPARGVSEVAVIAPAQFVVVPDFLGQDQVFQPATVEFSEIPADNMLLQLSHPDVIVMTVWKGTRTVRTLGSDPGKNSPCAGFRVISGGGDAAGAQSSDPAQPGLWVAVLQGSDLWNATDLMPERSGSEFELRWSPPVDAKWRTGIVETSSFTHCSLLEGPRGTADGESVTDSTSPCRFRAGKVVARVAPREQVGTAPSAPPGRKLLIYPLDRSRTTPLTMLLPIDVLRNTLGVGPCQYLLQAEGLASDDDPTPAAVMDEIERLFSRRRDRQSSEDIQQRLEQSVGHIGAVQARLEHYAAGAKRLQAIVDAQWKADSAQLPSALVSMREAFENLSPAIFEASSRTDAVQRARSSTQAIARLIGKPDALDDVRQHGEVLRQMGATQDRALANSRHLFRVLRALAQNQIAEPLRNSIESSVDAILASST